MADSDDDLQLSSTTMAALQEFMAEQLQRNQQLEQGTDFEEDWQLSQFWYDDNTADTIIDEILAHTKPGGKVACLSTPTIFRALKKRDNLPIDYDVFEYDKRFNVYGDQFVFYDYNEPLEIPHSTKGKYDFVVFDPPFLSEECIAKVAQTIDAIAKQGTKMILMTGKIQQDAITKHLPTFHCCEFKPKHARQLSNEFACFSNYVSPKLGVEK
eukprot:Phypoly_transcript_14574.p1 GENE.Phypoly_transcript_14574~~Phypoly_transcript_14574.p1  ORF type:complete len:212 (+),score=48.73 Phypoly_transcript_14574:340-975(+)